MATVSSLRVYPVKGCKGIELDTAVMTPTGLAFDRHWVVVKEGTMKFLTQRQIPQMCLIEVSLPIEALHGQWGQLDPGAALVLNAPHMQPVQVPLAKTADDSLLRECTVWEWSGLAQDEGDEVAQWLSEFMGTAVRLMRYRGKPTGLRHEAGEAQADPCRRPTDPEWGSGVEFAFADRYHVLLATEADLEDLNCHLATPLPMNRFRPNIILKDTEPWAADNWAKVKIRPQDEATGGIDFLVTTPCSRCKVTTVNQATGEVGLEPLATLANVRSGRVLGWDVGRKDWRHKVFFGWNAVAQQEGRLRVGDLAMASVRERPGDVAGV
ncbi:unnamed protein product [Ostreobium quekettii]|uniref:MOSC domain-containing protein n=1 Tax=Ostreobium quekettii TaxID=121088 RepID=A0A8S1IQJ8_9CHLO|nr:unnamed protein product [Ostreobium quekettii]